MCYDSTVYYICIRISWRIAYDARFSVRIKHGWTVYYTLKRRDKLGIVIRSPQATVSLEDRLTAQEVQMTEVLRILRDQGAAISEMAASLTTEPSERQRLYPRLHEGNGRQGFASTERQAGQSFGAVPQQRHTEVRDEGDQFDRQRQDQQGRQDRHPGQQRGDEGHVVYATAPAPESASYGELGGSTYDPEVRMTKYSEYYGTRAPQFRNGRITHDRAIESDNDFTRGYMREMVDEDSRVPRGGGRVLEQDHKERHTEVRDEGDRL
ncbi:hypothetical protein Sjap_026568 [Stephania japonica]|uniref:Uncharacterized protein n=1 Tax=Stephania japonica TaxID=461633 RepID=A0AAP0DYQ8_9MAGN